MRIALPWACPSPGPTLKPRVKRGDRERGVNIGLAGGRRRRLGKRPVKPQSNQSDRTTTCAFTRGKSAVLADSPRDRSPVERDFVTATRSPPTASARLRRSLVVTIERRSCATADPASASHDATMANAIAFVGLTSALARCSSASGNARSFRCPTPRRRGSPSPRWPGRKRRGVRSSSRFRGT